MAALFFSAQDVTRPSEFVLEVPRTVAIESALASKPPSKIYRVQDTEAAGLPLAVSRIWQVIGCLDMVSDEWVEKKFGEKREKTGGNKYKNYTGFGRTTLHHRGLFFHYHDKT